MADTEIMRVVAEEGDLPTGPSGMRLKVELVGDTRVHFVSDPSPSFRKTTSLCGVESPPFYIDHQAIREFGVDPFEKLNCVQCLLRYEEIESRAGVNER